MTALIRPFDPADLPVLQRIRTRAFEPIFRSFRDIVGTEIAPIALADADAEQARLLDAVCATGSGHMVWVAEEEREIAGFVSFSIDPAGKVGEIGLNAVDPDRSGRGLGRAMYEHVIAEMRQRGVRVATVGTGADPSHAPARRAYEHCGFGTPIPSVFYYKLL